MKSDGESLENSLDNVGMERLVGKSSFKLLRGGRDVSGEVWLSEDDINGGVVGLCLTSFVSLLTDLIAGVIKNVERFVELLLAEIIGVFVVESPRTGEFGKVNDLGLGLLGLDFFKRCLT